MKSNLGENKSLIDIFTSNVFAKSENQFDGSDTSGGLEGASAAGEKMRAALMDLDWNRDDEQLEKLAKVLKAQQVGISYLAEILLGDTTKVDDIIEKIVHHHGEDHVMIDKSDYDFGPRIR